MRWLFVSTFIVLSMLAAMPALCGGSYEDEAQTLLGFRYEIDPKRGRAKALVELVFPAEAVEESRAKVRRSIES